MVFNMPKILFQWVQGAAVAAGPTSRRCGEFKGTTLKTPQTRQMWLAQQKASHLQDQRRLLHEHTRICLAGCWASPSESEQVDLITPIMGAATAARLSGRLISLDWLEEPQLRLLSSKWGPQRDQFS